MSRDVTRTCAACGRPLSWWMSGTWLNQMLHCGRCRRSASRTRPPMTRSEKWSWVRHEAIVVGVVALAVCGLLRSGTVHFGPPPPDDAPYMHEYRGAVTVWQLGYAGIGGWVENLTDRDCPSMLAWVESYELDDLSRQLGPMGVANGYV